MSINKEEIDEKVATNETIEVESSLQISLQSSDANDRQKNKEAQHPHDTPKRKVRQVVVTRRRMVASMENLDRRFDLLSETNDGGPGQGTGYAKPVRKESKPKRPQKKSPPVVAAKEMRPFNEEIRPSPSPFFRAPPSNLHHRKNMQLQPLERPVYLPLS